MVVHTAGGREAPARDPAPSRDLPERPSRAHGTLSLGSTATVKTFPSVLCRGGGRGCGGVRGAFMSAFVHAVTLQDKGLPEAAGCWRGTGSPWAGSGSSRSSAPPHARQGPRKGAGASRVERQRPPRHQTPDRQADPPHRTLLCSTPPLPGAWEPSTLASSFVY